jgi:hypothetical protein
VRPRTEWLRVVADGQGREHVTSKNVGREERMKVMGRVRSILGGYNLLVERKGATFVPCFKICLLDG